MTYRQNATDVYFLSDTGREAAKRLGMTDSYRHALDDSKSLLCHPEPVEGSIETTSALAVSLANLSKSRPLDVVVY